MSKPCMVIFDDEMGVTCPYSWDPNCEGGLCGLVGEDMKPVIFPDRASARKAIRISTAYAKLRRTQGKPANEDFLEECKKCVKIFGVEIYQESEADHE